MKRNTALMVGLLSVVAMPALASCGAAEEAIVLHALNCEDYINDGAWTYYDEEGNALDFKSCLDGFEKLESQKLGKKVRVVYDTYDTNETMLSSLKTGKSVYDLICASDYTIQKMMSMGMLWKFEGAEEAIPNYYDYCSRYHLSMMNAITAEVPTGEGDKTTTEKMADYSVGYMWGTLGILYNPAKIASDKGLDLDEIKYDMASWDSLWNPKYKGEASIKDSMRDTYSAGIMHVFRDEIVKDMTASGCFDMEASDYALLDGEFEAASTTYNPLVTEIFNRCDEKTVALVKEDLLKLKENIFGFEVDSGKDDMVKGHIGMNLAWSGDAVYAIDKAENEADNYIYYSIPATGGNIWFDSWAIPSASEHKDVAMDFLNYLSDPQVAASNMDNIGYSSFIAGDEVHNLVREWYDPRSYAMWAWHDAVNDTETSTWEDSYFLDEAWAEDLGYTDLFIVKEGGAPENPADRVPAELVFDENSGYAVQTGLTYYRYLLDKEGNRIYENGQAKFAKLPEDFGGFDMTGSTFESAVVNGEEVTWEIYQNIYNEALTAQLLEEGYDIESPEFAEVFDEKCLAWSVRDLTYMFQGTLSEEPEEATDSPDTNPFLFYSDEIEEITLDEENPEATTVTAGRQFYAQYPDQNLIPKLAVMRDYGENNKFVLAMWTDVKSNNLPLAGVIVFAIILVTAGAFILASVLTKRHYHKIKVRRRKEVSR